MFAECIVIASLLCSDLKLMMEAASFSDGGTTSTAISLEELLIDKWEVERQPDCRDCDMAIGRNEGSICVFPPGPNSTLLNLCLSPSKDSLKGFRGGGVAERRRLYRNSRQHCKKLHRFVRK
ncbi:hypothetical protein H2248_003496 [Termitomyces sp. 'cryptogamus']|nr:hypothetical protein H2248_003496 [Termitomyces sp. 'cryptogamus']